MYTAYILSAVCSTFDSFSQNKANVPWVDAELAIYLLFIYHEVLRAPCVFVVPGSQPPIKNPMSEMMSKLVMSSMYSALF